MKRLSLLVLCSVLQQAADAAEELPEQFLGSWGTSASLWQGKDPQAELHLLADGFGGFLGSTHEGRRTDGVADGKPGPRAVIGFPVQATLDGNTLHLRPLGISERDVKALEGKYFSCSYDAAEPAMTCIGPDNNPILLTRRSATIPAEILSMIETLRHKVP